MTLALGPEGATSLALGPEECHVTGARPRRVPRRWRSALPSAMSLALGPEEAMSLALGPEECH
eukprot:7318874-Alexandrium_andersonii.AAC.1